MICGVSPYICIDVFNDVEKYVLYDDNASVFFNLLHIIAAYI